MEKFDVIIIGAGPSGLSAAKILGEGGKKVLLLEKNPKIGPKICAGGLTFKDFEFEIPTSLTERSFHSMKIHCFNKILEVKNKKRALVTTINREGLGQWMAGEIKKNVEIRLNSEVIEIGDNSIILKDNQEIGFDYLIGADGSLSLVRKHLNLPTKKIFVAIQYVVPEIFPELEVFFDKSLFGSGYAWIFPYSNHTSIGCGADLKFKEPTSLFTNFQHWLKEKKMDFDQAELQSFPINFDYQGFNFGNKFLTGDAGGFASGLTGEGIYFAIASGQEIAKKILDSSYKLSDLKKILKIKKEQEVLGKLLMFTFLRSKILTQYSFAKYF
ncbi:NAD(P)/FAD-dependent oxidoreductase [Patescibacteria group bacterium]|nr:NAD(P)/FAD-dependent oxidoreductase [Patescibacteria group bacterium]MBU1876824.1 NAD(P)/FAD-dependent oxidoreductase [Patescibacteria group bacterium]